MPGASPLVWIVRLCSPASTDSLRTSATVSPIVVTSVTVMVDGSLVENSIVASPVVGFGAEVNVDAVRRPVMPTFERRDGIRQTPAPAVPRKRSSPLRMRHVGPTSRGNIVEASVHDAPSGSERGVPRDAYLEGLEFLGRERLRRGELDEAIETSRRILCEDSISDTAREILMLALKRRGRIGEARRALEQCVRAYQAGTSSAPPRRLLTLLDD